MKEARGILVLDSMEEGAVPAALERYVVHRYSHLINRKLLVTVCELRLPDDDAPRAAFEISLSLKPRRFYAHLISGDLLFVAFPMSVALVRNGDVKAASRARRIGELFGIPREEMLFEQLFFTDHPDDY